MNRRALGIALAVAAVLLPYLPSLKDLAPGKPTKPDRPTIEVPASVAEGLKAGFAESKEDAGGLDESEKSACIMRACAGVIA